MSRGLTGRPSPRWGKVPSVGLPVKYHAIHYSIKIGSERGIIILKPHYGSFLGVTKGDMDMHRAAESLAPGARDKAV